jgi:hypothetical protein
MPPTPIPKNDKVCKLSQESHIMQPIDAFTLCQKNRTKLVGFREQKKNH